MGRGRRRYAVEAPAITAWALVRGYYTKFEPGLDSYSGITRVYPVDDYVDPWAIHFDRTTRMATCSHPLLGRIARGDMLDVLAEFDRVIAASDTPYALRPACD
jgi:hypothetical protein